LIEEVLMSMPPPVWSSLWADIVTHHPTIQWPVANETDMALLAQDWDRLGSNYLNAAEIRSVAERDIVDAWTGEAGQEYQRQVDEARKNSRETGYTGLDMRELVQYFADSVRISKKRITELIDKHDEFYVDVTDSMWAWFHPAEAREEAERYRRSIANEVSEILHNEVSYYKSQVEALDARSASRGG
jgi:hypothetical protein